MFYLKTVHTVSIESAIPLPQVEYSYIGPHPRPVLELAAYKVRFMSVKFYTSQIWSNMLMYSKACYVAINLFTLTISLLAATFFVY